jgi:hypothetical protein
MPARAALQLDLLSRPDYGGLRAISRELVGGRLELILELCLKDLDFIFELGVFDSLVQVPLIGLAQLPIELVVALDEFGDLLLLL